MTESEISKAREIVGRYAEIDSEFAALNDRLKALKEKKDELLAMLEENERAENEFAEALRRKYGDIDYNEIFRRLA